MKTIIMTEAVTELIKVLYNTNITLTLQAEIQKQSQSDAVTVQI
jgi:hypothetical protein